MFSKKRNFLHLSGYIQVDFMFRIFVLRIWKAIICATDKKYNLSKLSKLHLKYNLWLKSYYSY